MQQDARAADGLADRGRVVGDDRQAEAHRLEERHAEPLVLRERHEALRGAVVREQRRAVDAAGEVHRAPETQPLDERDHAGVILRLVAERAHEHEVRLRIDAAPVVREHAHQIVLPLVWRDPTDEEEHATETLPAREHRVVGRRREVRPVDEDGHASRLLVAGLGERAAVELGDADAKLERRRDPRELPQPEPRMGGGVRIDAAEELGGRDVVVDEDASRLDLHELVDDLVAHREVDDEHVVRLHVAEQPAVRAHVGDAGLRLDRVRVRVIAPSADAFAEREDVVAHRVGGREDRMELVDGGHDGARPTTA